MDSVHFRNLKAVLIHSDDWGFPGWTPSGAVASALRYESLPLPYCDYGYSGLESEADLEALFSTLLSFRDGAGLPVIIQANYVVGSLQYKAVGESGELSFCELPDVPDGWLGDGIVSKAIEGIGKGVWWPEYHGYTHCNASWVREMAVSDRRAQATLKLASPPFYDKEAWLEYKSNSTGVREGLRNFANLFRYHAVSTVPPNYTLGCKTIWSLMKNGISIFQAPERWVSLDLSAKILAKTLRHLGYIPLLRVSAVPRHVDFEPRGKSGNSQGGPIWAEALEAAVRRLKAHGFVCISSHRLNYVHHSTTFKRAGLLALHGLLGGILQEFPEAIFLTDTEYIQIRRFGASLSRRGRSYVFRNVTRSARKLSTNIADGAPILRALRLSDGGGVRFLKSSRRSIELRVEPGTHVIDAAGD